jgi:hypothetical protein
MGFHEPHPPPERSIMTNPHPIAGPFKTVLDAIAAINLIQT